MYRRADLRRVRPVLYTERRARCGVWPRIATNPKLSPRLGESMQSRMHPPRCLPAQDEKEPRMETLFRRCGGMDAHKERVGRSGSMLSRRWEAASGDTPLGDDDRGSKGDVSLAGGSGGHPCGHGIHRGILETDLQPLGRSLPGGAGESSTPQAVAGAQDGCERLPMNCPIASTWAPARQLHLTATPVGIA
jgi:hypothetical protein